MLFRTVTPTILMFVSTFKTLFAFVVSKISDFHALAGCWNFADWG